LLYNLIDVLTVGATEKDRFLLRDRPRGTFKCKKVMNAVNHSRRASNLIVGLVFLFGALVVGLVAFLA
jgi:hypothetical protein